MNRATRRAIGVVCCLALVSGLSTVPAAAQSGGEGERFHAGIAVAVAALLGVASMRYR